MGVLINLMVVVISPGSRISRHRVVRHSKNTVFVCLFVNYTSVKLEEKKKKKERKARRAATNVVETEPPVAE